MRYSRRGKAVDLSDNNKVLDKNITSRCPTCKKISAARLLEKHGQIFQQINCSEHGIYENLIFSNSELFRKLETWNRQVHNGLAEETDTLPCSASCVHCGGHRNPTALAVIDITNRCNHNCPICFAGANSCDTSYFLGVEEVSKMLTALLENKPYPCKHVQFSGGEPTLNPRFLEMVKLAHDMGFDHIQVATNGTRFLDESFLEKCENAGLHTLYLQFDGMDDDVYWKLRGKPLLNEKISIVKKVKESNMRIVLVPTIISGINVDQLGPIFKFALEHSSHITGISIQPLSATGRIQFHDETVEPFNLADMAIEFSKQTGLTSFPEDWFPLNAISTIVRGLSNLRGEDIPGPTCDAHCSLGTYFYVDDTGKAYCINHFFDLEKFFKEISSLSPAGSSGFFKQRFSRYQEFKRLKSCFDRQRAPGGLTFERMLQALDGWEDKSIGRTPGWEKYGYNGIFIAGMHFMDHSNFNIQRLNRCIIHYVTVDGRRIPFCNYNAGIRIRDEEESIRSNGCLKILDRQD